jgi:2-iminobutanoate/2-iminopropanoate deaminase
MTVQRIPGPEGFSYSDVTAIDGAGRLVFVAGQVGWDAEGRVVEGLGAQSRACFDLIEGHLRKVGASLADVVKVNASVTTLDNYAEYGEARAEAFGNHLPASATVQVAGLLAEGALIEIEAIAFVPGEDQ